MRKIFHQTDLQSRFERDGFVEVDLLGSAELAQLIDLYEGHSMSLAGAPVTFSAMIPESYHRRAISDGIRHIVTPLLDRVLVECRSVMGSFFCKAPSPDSEIHIHQDWSFVDEAQHHSMTVWCPLENVTAESGTLSVVPGSHRLPCRPRGFVNRFAYPHLETALKDRFSQAVTATPGRVVMFDQRLLHWSSPNRSSSRRLAASTFVAPSDATIVFPHPDPVRHPDQVELFLADDDLLNSFTILQRPDHAASLGLVSSGNDPLSVDELERVLSSH